MKKINEIIAKNIYNLRTERKWTQSQLAEKLNYSDKSVSKWELGDVTPPVEVLISLSELFGVSVDYLLTDNPPENFDKKYGDARNKNNKIIITLLAVSLVWLIAILLYVYGFIIANNNYWQVFIFALPFSFIVLLVFNCLWGLRKLTFLIISCLVWTVILSVYFLFISYNAWAIFFIGIPLQIGVILWSQLKTEKHKNKK